MASEIPRMTIPIRTGETVLGEITLEPDGTFHGEFHNKDVFFGMQAVLKNGFGDSMAIYVNMIPETDET